MKVVIDSRLQSGEEGGFEQCCIGLARGLQEVATGQDQYMFLTLEGHSVWLKPHVAGNVSILETRAHNSRSESPKSLLGPLRPLMGRMSRKLGITEVGRSPASPPHTDSIVTRIKFDVWHTLHPYAAVTSQKKPVVLTVHDLQHLHLPEYFTQEHLTWRNEFYEKAIAASTRVTTISEFCRRDIVGQFPTSAEKIDVIHWAAPLSCYAPVSGARAADVLRRHGIRRPYALYPSVTYGHKNHQRLIQAAAELNKQGRRVHIVCTGKQKHVWPDIAKQLESSGLGDAVRFTGFVSQSDMRVIFEMAHAVIFPSLFEGAGLGVVEAMHMGKPIACSDIPAFREYVGAGAYYFDPHDVQAIAHALYIVMKDEQIRTELLKTVRSSQLDNWRDVARQYIQIYRRADAARRTSRGLLCDETPQSPILTSA